jgi:ADP-ribose pyrophosphatase YjhB (NUDIX family)
MSEQWMMWARRLQALAQTGLTYAESPFEVDRYLEIRSIAAEMMARGDAAQQAFLEEQFAQQAGYATPKVDVRGVVFRDHRVLLVGETMDAGRWTLPGGWADVNDLPSAAVEREVWEEAGYRVRATKLLALHDRSKRNHPPASFHIYKLFFLCELLDDRQELQANIETTEARWFSEDELPALELSSGRTTLPQLERLFEHHRHPDWPADFD